MDCNTLRLEFKKTMTKLNERDDYALILQAIGRGYFKLRDRLLESGLVKQVCKAVMGRQKSNF